MISTLDKVALETSGSLALKTGFDLGWAPGTATYLVGKGVEGWTGSSPIRRNKTELLGAHGTHAERGFKDERLITVTGHHVAADRAAAGLFADDLAAYLGDGTEGILRVDDASLGSRWVEVYLAAGGVDVTWTGGVDVRFQINMVAPDPRKYGTLSTSVATGIPVPGNGLVFPLFSRQPTTTSTRTNLATNPSMETASGTVNVRTNLATNPSFAAATTGWFTYGTGSPAISWQSGAGATGNGFARATFGGTSSVGDGGFYGSDTTVVAGNVCSSSMWVRANKSTRVSLGIEWRTAGAFISQDFGAEVILTANTWTLLTITNKTAPGSAVIARLIVGARTGTGSVAWVASDTFDIDGVLLEQSAVVGQYFDGATPITNLVTNPSFETDTTGWTGNTGSPTLTASPDRAYVGVNSLKAVSTTASADIAVAVVVTLTPGVTYTLSYYVYSADARTSYFDVAATNLNLSNVGSKSVPANTWTRVSATFTTTSNMTGAATFYLHNGGGPAVTGSIVYIDAVLLEKTDVLSPVFYEGQGDFTYVWSGTANASTSYQQAPGISGVGEVASLARVHQSGIFATGGAKSLRIAPVTASGGDTFAEIGPMVTGYTFKANTTYTISGDRTLAAPLTGATGTTGYRINIGTELTPTYITPPANVAGTTRVVATFTTGAGTGLNFIRTYNGASAGGGDVWWDRITLEEGATTGTYFDGSSPAATIDTDTTASHAWSGTANASTSIQTIQDYAGPNGVLDIGSGGYLGRASVTNRGTADAGPRFTIWGDYVPGFTLTDLATGRRLVYTETITTGQTLVLDANDGSVTLDGYAPRDSKLVVSDWTRLGRGETGTWQLDSPGSTAAQFTVGVTPAWW